ncbi:preprotein translocase subunit SecG [bacterium]|nr:preprotein translocase subunit SecG [bacterium]
MANILWTIATFSAVLLIILILMHSPKGDGIGGIGGASHIFASQKSAEKGLNKLTGIVCAIFIICSFLIGLGIVK